MSREPPSIVRYVFTHAVPIMLRHRPEDWWKACRELPPGEIKDEVTAWLRREKHKMDCWARYNGPAEIGKPRR